jgi:uncharacterized membrane protein (UPF0127 family)
MRSLFVFLSACLLLGSCAGDDAAQDHRFRRVVLPDGTVVRAETMMNQVDMAKGMMFRESLPGGRGMLFVHAQPGNHPYWMYQVKIPLDLVWMDINGRVTEFVENAPPCKTAASECPNFGGNAQSQVVLELPAGYARRHGVQVGSVIQL